MTDPHESSVIIAVSAGPEQEPALATSYLHVATGVPSPATRHAVQLHLLPDRKTSQPSVVLGRVSRRLRDENGEGMNVATGVLDQLLLARQRSILLLRTGWVLV